MKVQIVIFKIRNEHIEKKIILLRSFFSKYNLFNDIDEKKIINGMSPKLYLSATTWCTVRIIIIENGIERKKSFNFKSL